MASACPPYLFVDREDLITILIDSITQLPTSPPSIYIDLEGDNLSRFGNISIMQIYLAPVGETYLVDILSLGKRAFNTPGSNGFTTLKAVLEHPIVPKVFFDVRNDSDALFAHYGVRLAGVHDLQLMELTCRWGCGRFVWSLEKCVRCDLLLTPDYKAAWVLVKERGRKLLSPAAGGSYAVFNERPLSEDIRLYCIQDIVLLPSLWHVYAGHMWPQDWSRVLCWSVMRVEESKESDYQPVGPWKRLAPNW